MDIIQDPVFYLVALPAVIAIGLSKGGFAGVGTMATPLLALYAPPLQAAAILLPIVIIQDIISVWVYRRDWDPWNLKVLLTGATLGVGLAWAIAAHVSDDVIRVAVGLIGLGFVMNVWFGRPPAAVKRPSPVAGVFWGGLSGFTSTLSQGGGPPFQVFVLPQKLPKLRLVGTTTIFFAVVNALKVVPYFALGHFTGEALGTSTVLLPLAVVSNFLGIWLVRRTPTELFYKISYILIFLISVALLWQGTSPYLFGRG
ncbi:sulfite exporter TauE/SafE family protein [Rhodoplanes sp. TEM]|uniref:Probable membrane transporter protein n=1 Tax=Rhodoplanes tepidamans TaxID=200616 RepID=A0ABT5J5F7_RHOTP|nr:MULTISPECIES: sulfite exporter TauE/SafE family protein [Rhodoplanes]MDC7784862.1 sulfite exporter TauE/SafE family protein [Rhodoplanes tepidamans]MDC7986048.1 sulfite exporter TauE/SafE family protein [Rhodoplanes sp. TEM]MDQ0353911.1 putative membrane protein YfcA [Rhodoplanes tepidamans]